MSINIFGPGDADDLNQDDYDDVEDDIYDDEDYYDDSNELDYNQ